MNLNEFKPCPLNENYLVSKTGEIWSIKTSQLLNPFFKGASKYIDFREPNSRLSVTVAEVVLSTFERVRRPGEYIVHLDGDANNNSLKNLRWGTLGEARQAKRENTTSKAILSRLRSIWANMKIRCVSSLAYEHIEICEEWKSSFPNFVVWSLQNGYDQSLSIDRIDNSGNYEPSNCRWATAREQANNTRRNKFYSAFGESKTLSQWSEDDRCKVPLSTLISRSRSKWPLEKALITPKLVTKPPMPESVPYETGSNCSCK